MPEQNFNMIYVIKISKNINLNLSGLCIVVRSKNKHNKDRKVNKGKAKQSNKK